MIQINTLEMQQAIEGLERHPEVGRIKKLIYWVCEQRWPQADEDLEALRDLLPRLFALIVCESPPCELGEGEPLVATPTALREMLLKGVSTLSKPQQYGEIAFTICKAVAPIFGSEACVGLLEAEQPHDLLTLRLAVMKYTVPLHAKILIQSALDEIFMGRRRDWIVLRQISLDDLLLRLCQTFSTFSELEERLQATVEQLEILEQPTQARDAVLQAVRPLYLKQRKGSDRLAARTGTEVDEPIVARQRYVNDLTPMGTGNS